MGKILQWIDRLLPFQFDIEHLPGAIMGLVDYISQNQFQLAKKISFYDKEFIVAKLNLISRINSLDSNKALPKSHLHQLLKTHNPALQITPKVEANNKAINLISTHAARVRKHNYYNSPAPRNLAPNTTCNLNNLKYVDPASQISLNTSLAQNNTNKYKKLVQNRSELALAPRETQILNSKFPPMRRKSTNNFKSHHTQINSVPFASLHSTIQSCNPNSRNKLSSKFSSEIKSINQFNSNMPSKKRITRVRFNDACRAANQQSSSHLTRHTSTLSNTSDNTRTASQRTISNNTTRAASPLQILTPRSPAHSSNASTPLTSSPHLPTFDYIVSKIFNKSLIASLTGKDAVLKEIRGCILTNNERPLKSLNPYIHSHWRDLHVQSGCVCIDEKVAILNVLREALIGDIHASHPGTWGMICITTHCLWPYMHHQLIVKATECKPCTVIGKNLKSLILAKQFHPDVPCV